MGIDTDRIENAKRFIRVSFKPETLEDRKCVKLFMRALVTDKPIKFIGVDNVFHRAQITYSISANTRFSIELLKFPKKDNDLKDCLYYLTSI